MEWRKTINQCVGWTRKREQDDFSADFWDSVISASTCLPRRRMYVRRPLWWGNKQACLHFICHVDIKVLLSKGTGTWKCSLLSRPLLYYFSFSDITRSEHFTPSFNLYFGVAWQDMCYSFQHLLGLWFGSLVNSTISKYQFNDSPKPGKELRGLH